MMGMLVTTMAVGQLVTRTGRYRVFPIVGGVFMTAGMLLLAQLTVDSTRLTTGLFMLVLGAGLGFLMQNTMLIAQNSVEMKDMGAASGAATLFRTIGGSLGVSILGAVYSNQLTGALTDRLGEQAGRSLSGGGGQLTPALLKQMPPTSVTPWSTRSPPASTTSSSGRARSPCWPSSPPGSSARPPPRRPDRPAHPQGPGALRTRGRLTGDSPGAALTQRTAPHAVGQRRTR